MSNLKEKAVYAIATMDTKGNEIAFVAEIIKRAGTRVVTVDVGTKSAPVVSPDISREQVAGFYPKGANTLLHLSDRGQAVTAMSQALSAFLQAESKSGKIAGVIGLGGTGGTALIAPAMQALAIGIPKLLVSTVASGNTQPYVGCSDITLMHSVVDVGGLNRISREVLGNAARAIAGMAQKSAVSYDSQPTLGMTMFGLTTPCVTEVRQQLEERGFDCMVFHATGTGGQAMEKLVSSHMIDGVLDITTTEVADEIVGGVFRAGPERFDAILERGIPWVVSLGALDMVNFGARETVPSQFAGRNLYTHNSQVTLMRTTPEENRQIAQWIARKINRAKAPVTLLIPEKGVSGLDAVGQPFYDPEADCVLFCELETLLQKNEQCVMRRLPYHINDRLFASALVSEYLAIAERR